MKTRPFVIFTLGASLLAGHPWFVGDSRAEAAPAPKVTSPATDKKELIAYRIARDVVGIFVEQEPDLTFAKKRIDVNGNINLPLVGDIHIEGLTQAEAQTAIEKAYRDGRFLRNPQVTVSIEEYAVRSITVTGLVKVSGLTSLPPETITTLKDVITRAQPQDTANLHDVRISRPQPDGKEDRIYHKNVDGILRAKDNRNTADANFIIEPGDTIYVPENVF